MYSLPNFEPVHFSMSGSNCCFLTCIQVLQEADKVVWYSHLFKNFPQFVMIHTVKGFGIVQFSSVQFISVAQLWPTLCNPMNCSTLGLPIPHQLLEFIQIHVHQVGDAIQPCHPLSSPSPAPNPSQHQSFFQSVNSLHEVAKVLEFQLWHQSFQRTPRSNLL